MKTTIKKSVVLELSEEEATALRTFMATVRPSDMEDCLSQEQTVHFSEIYTELDNALRSLL